jgi:hypothetical protein
MGMNRQGSEQFLIFSSFSAIAGRVGNVLLATPTPPMTLASKEIFFFNVNPLQYMY